ncbi:PRD domain-containing protein [Halalkalibacter nanhaiisediminis]|uniref:BglG family transcriptional antiterminator n=1 Tax=Halalkalibacter nanhaiisediminis TaxID=688079 RepID=A0A562QJW2_9BACI|nr:PRD domain-containing protein [Halalkalibacter nanhaiisediminis]TWI57042.1 BglG family transcriptional antiterminator [Halalkalibacter nanhaiisediminis]
MFDQYIIMKILNNNVVIANDQTGEEVILIGKGIGFGQSKGALINQAEIDKLFILGNPLEQEQYKQLLTLVDESFISLMEDIVVYIVEESGKALHERIHIALTDHLQFAIKRLEQGIDITNPFLTETALMFPAEYEIASKVVDRVNDSLGVKLPESEIGFVALHIYSAQSNRSIAELDEHPQLVLELVEMIESGFQCSIERNSVTYMRLVTFLCDVINRFKENQAVSYSEQLANLLKVEFHLCYTVTAQIVERLNQTFLRYFTVEQLPDVVFYIRRFSKHP